jgi:predicted transcriptional regulator
MKKDYSLISFLNRASRRKKVLEHLKEPKTPKQISTELDLSISNVSNALAELKEKGLIEILNPKDHLARYYQRTKKGTDLLGEL